MVFFFMILKISSNSLFCNIALIFMANIRLIYLGITKKFMLKKVAIGKTMDNKELQIKVRNKMCYSYSIQVVIN